MAFGLAAWLRHLYHIHINFQPHYGGLTGDDSYVPRVPQSSHEGWMTAGIIYTHTAQYAACIVKFFFLYASEALCERNDSMAIVGDDDVE